MLMLSNSMTPTCFALLSSPSLWLHCVETDHGLLHGIGLTICLHQVGQALPVLGLVCLDHGASFLQPAGGLHVWIFRSICSCNSMKCWHLLSGSRRRSRRFRYLVHAVLQLRNNAIRKIVSRFDEHQDTKFKSVCSGLTLY